MRRFLPPLLLLPSLLFATAQYPEKIHFGLQEEQLMATPLEEYWTAEHPKPATLSQTSLACWRGYIGTWEIREGKLYLLGLERHETVPQDDNFIERTINVPLRPILRDDCPVFAAWFSGVLRVARGNVLLQVNTGYASVYEEDLYFVVEHGNIIQRRTVKNDPATLTSENDLACREFGRISATGGISAVLPEEADEAETGDWMELTELVHRRAELASAKTSFAVRGIHFPGKLWLPNRAGVEATYPLDTPGIEQLPANGIAIEATCTLVETDQGPRLLASEILELPPGSAIQRRCAVAKNSLPASSPKLAADTPGVE